MRAVAWLSTALLLSSACAEDRQPPPNDGGGSSSTGTTAGSSTGAVMPDLGAAESTGAGWPLPTDDDLLQCVRTCEVPHDCCPPGSQGLCPSGTFPYNFMCIDGLCVEPPCTSDDDCVSEGEACVVIRGAPRCVVPCDSDDAPCIAVANELTCSGNADDGRRYCLAHCENPGVFCGNQSCDAATGECVCTSAGQCQVDWECV
jgi:hypothetical protein